MRAWLSISIGLLLLVAQPASADTIVLKNGRRILALSAVEAGDKVRYQTAAGELTLPRSIVDHIERGGAMPSSAASLAMAPPAAESGLANAAAESGAVHDGTVDRAFLAKAVAEARSGNAQANAAAAMAHHAVALFEMSHGDLEHALADERSALTYAPNDPALLLSAAFLHLRRSEFKQGLDYLDRAKRVAPDNADIPKLAGWAYYGLNKPKEAVREWQRALALRPDAEVQTALQKAQRDQQEEENYRENESSHFSLKYSGEAEPQLAREVLRALEMHFSAIESELNYTPPEPIGVILYTQQAFADITQAPGWVGAINDGRIRVPVQGLTQLTLDLSRVLKHELTHSFVRQKTRGHAPTWVQEGLAQWMEGKRSGPTAGTLVQDFEQQQARPLADLEGSWIQLPADEAGFAYAWALATVEYIVQVDGMGDMERILDRMAAGGTTEAAVHEVLRSNYAELMQSTVHYLRQSSGN
jgi:tetratricopeptide (TPR) repeat protein